jgi:hypothetical protein
LQHERTPWYSSLRLLRGREHQVVIQQLQQVLQGWI